MKGLGRRLVTFMAALVLAGLVFAADLDSAKRDGFLGEQRDGYLGLVNPQAPSEIRTLMDDVNRKRQQHYRELAAREGIDLKKVELLAGEKAVNKTTPGNYVQDVSGRWIKK